MDAWHDFIIWAWNEPEMRALFTAKTGIEIQQVTSPIYEIYAAIYAMINATIGAGASVEARFIEWATCEHWGVEHAPAAYRKVIANKGKAPEDSP
jgi:hypothetical protein